MVRLSTLGEILQPGRKDKIASHITYVFLKRNDMTRCDQLTVHSMYYVLNMTLNGANSFPEYVFKTLVHSFHNPQNVRLSFLTSSVVKVIDLNYKSCLCSAVAELKKRYDI